MRMHRLMSCLSAFVMISTLTGSAAFAQGAAATDSGAVAVRVRPAQADVFIDGERWVGPETDGRLVVQLAPGRHRIEIRAAGYRPFATEIDVRAGQTTPLNVSLSGAPPERAMPGPVRGPIAPVTVETGDSGFAIAPDFRVTELNGRTAQLAGAYGGLVFGGHFLIGAGGYWQPNPSNDTRLAYGGAVLEWRQWTDRTIGFTAHGLIGAGGARFGTRFAFDDGDQDFRVMRDIHFNRREAFFVAEPEAQIVARLGSQLHLHVGVGYRVTSIGHGGGDELNGVSGSISLQFGR